MNAPLRFHLPVGTHVSIAYEVQETNTYKIPSAEPTLSRWPGGFMLEQYCMKKNVGLFMLTFSITQRIAIPVEALQNFNTIQYTLKGDTLALLKGHGFIPLVDHTYTPMYIPAGIHTVWFEPGEYVFFYILLTEDQLDELAEDHPYLVTLIKKIRTVSTEGVLLDRMIIDQSALGIIKRLDSIDPQDAGISLELQEITIDLLRLYNKHIALRKQTDRHISSDEYADMIKLYVIDHIVYSEKENLQELKKLFNTTERTLERHFKKKFRQPLRSYIKHQRLERSRYMLLAEKNSVTEVALKMGYYDTASYSKQFTKHFGYSPKQAREHFFQNPSTNDG